VHICAGSGVVPNLSILKHALAHELRVRHTLIFGNKTRQDVIFRGQLDELAQRYPDKLDIVHTLSREPDISGFGPGYRTGRVNLELIKAYIPDPTAVEVYTCGPAIDKWAKLAAKESNSEPTPRFMESVLAALDELGVPKDRIHRESYG
jgi:ferredoxin-NADP reductase